MTCLRWSSGTMSYMDPMASVASPEARQPGKVLRSYRLRAGFTQEDLAEAAGISARSVSDIERGKQSPSPRTTRRLAEAMGLSADQRDRFVEELLSVRDPGHGEASRSVPASASPRPHGRLPAPTTRLIGRDPELAAIARMLRDPDIRMVTLTGPAGSGKSRLALQIGENLLADFPDGVFFVSLSSLADPLLVSSAVAEVLAIKEEGGRALLETVCDRIKEKQLLLLIDNYEHLLGAAGVVARLLDACRNLHVLVTSQVPLHLSRENEYGVHPLSIPDPEHIPNPSVLAGYESVRLFVERAGAVSPDFTLTDDNAVAVASICIRLDGLPLAIELAAARVKVFPPQALLRRLDRRLRLLTGGAKDNPARHQTLRAAIDWSHSMLNADHQSLFARLSVFSGGCSVESAEAICTPGAALDVLEGITSLVDKSLLRQEGKEEPRLRMLETIREYAGEKLGQSGEEKRIREAHALFFLALAEEAADELAGPRQGEWLARLDAELDNLREAMRWFLSSSRAGEELRLAVGLFPFLRIHGHWSEAQRWLELGLAGTENIDPGLEARALSVLAMFLWMRDDPDHSIEMLKRALDLASVAGDRLTRAHTLNRLGVIYSDQRSFEPASRCFDESLEVARELGTRELQGIVLNNLGALAGNREDREAASRRYREALVIYTELEMTDAMCVTQINLGWIALREGNVQEAEGWFNESLVAAQRLGDNGRVMAALEGHGRVAVQSSRLDDAERYFQESLSLARELSAQRSIAIALVSLGDVSRRKGDIDQAREHLCEGLALTRELGRVEDELEALDCTASLACAEGRHERAARLKAAELAERERAHITPDLLVAKAGRSLCQSLRASLGDAAFAQAWTEGETMSLHEALTYALSAKE